MSEVIGAITAARVVAVLRARDVGELRDRAQRSLDLGVRILEVTTTCPGWDEVLSELSAAAQPRGDVVAGAGTVTSREQVVRSLAAGARFMVAPRRVDPVARLAAGDTPFIEGGFTPTEIAAVSGRWPVKLFPASTGGIAHLRAVLDIQPGLQVMPTGGIRPQDIATWLQSGAMAVGIGSALFDEHPTQVRELILDAAR